MIFTDPLFLFVFLPIALIAFHPIARSVSAAFFRYGTFVSFFPQLIIGPITYVGEVKPQIQSRRFLRLNPVDLAAGLGFISIGMFNKVITRGCNRAACWNAVGNGA
ncbi:hypothetical protein [Aurantiacibacter hainanensis]|uniref:hypothetical protein n=1 Tax=Aurantiacibacter hainanensis TaxID=3076114 RepID=UPI0030C66889